VHENRLEICRGRRDGPGISSIVYPFSIVEKKRGKIRCDGAVNKHRKEGAPRKKIFYIFEVYELLTSYKGDMNEWGIIGRGIN
jgi:hypothetical protein